MKYRIVMTGTDRYHGQYRGWWPFWEYLPSNSKDTVDAVRADIMDHMIRRREPVLATYED